MALEVPKKKSIWDKITTPVATVAKGVGKSIWETGDTASSAVKYAAGKITDNKQAVANASQNFSQSIDESVIGGGSRGLKFVAKGISANRESDIINRATEEAARMNRNNPFAVANIYNDSANTQIDNLAGVGVGLNDSRGTLLRKYGAHVGNIALDAASVASGVPGFSAGRTVAKEGARQGVFRPIVKSAGMGATGNLLQSATGDNQNYFTSAATGALTGAFIPAVPTLAGAWYQRSRDLGPLNQKGAIGYRSPKSIDEARVNAVLDAIDLPKGKVRVTSKKPVSEYPTTVTPSEANGLKVTVGKDGRVRVNPNVPVTKVPKNTAGKLTATKGKTLAVAPLEEYTRSKIGDTRYRFMGNETADAVATDWIAQNGVERAATALINDPTESAVHVAARARLAVELSKSGQDELAAQVMTAHINKASTAGQVLQAYKNIDKLSPQGVLLFTQRIFDKKKELFPNLKLTPEIEAKVQELAAIASKLPEGDAKVVAIHALVKYVSKQIPSTKTDKMLGLWKAGLLTGVKGQLGNVIGNSSNLTLRKVSDIAASLVDNIQSIATGRRAKTFTLGGLFEGFREGNVRVKNLAKYGVDPQKFAEDKFNLPHLNYGDSIPGKIAQGYTDLVYGVTGAGDIPFRSMAYKTALRDIALAEAKNQKIPRAKRKAFIKRFVSKPTEEAVAIAQKSAEQAVYADQTALGAMLAGAKQPFSNKGGASQGVAEIILPFTGVPASVATQVFDYTPVGAVKSVYNAIVASKNGGYDLAAQRALSEGLGKAVTGVGVLWLGLKLKEADLINLAYPREPAERQQWELEGRTPYSVNIGGKWRALNYTGPVAGLLSAGAALAEGGPVKSIFEVGKTTIASSPLQGVSGALSALTDTTPSANSDMGLTKSADRFVKNTAGSVVPTLVKDISNATDSTQRIATNPLESVQARIPGVRKNLPAKLGAFGTELPQEPGGVRAVIDPFKSSEAKTSDLTKVLAEQLKAGQGLSIPKPEKKATVDGKSVEFTPEQQREMSMAQGPAIKSAYESLIKTPDFQNATPEERKEMLQKSDNAIIKTIREQKARNQPLDASPTERVINDIKVSDLPKEVQGVVLATADLDTNQKQSYFNSTPTPETTGLFGAIGKEIPNGQSIKPNNQTAYEYSQLKQKLLKNKDSDGNPYSEFDRVRMERSFWKEAFIRDTPLAISELYAASISDVERFISNGAVKKADLDAAIELDNRLLEAKLIESPRFSKKFRRSVGASDPPITSDSASKSGGGSAKTKTISPFKYRVSYTAKSAPSGGVSVRAKKIAVRSKTSKRIRVTSRKSKV